jgi:hypothetical protein
MALHQHDFQICDSLVNIALFGKSKLISPPISKIPGTMLAVACWPLSVPTKSPLQDSLR